jgi:hypothetical protein
MSLKEKTDPEIERDWSKKHCLKHSNTSVVNEDVIEIKKIDIIDL